MIRGSACDLFADGAFGRKLYPRPKILYGTAHPFKIITPQFQQNTVFVSVGGAFRHAPELFCTRYRDWRTVEAVFVSVDGQWRACAANIPKTITDAQFSAFGVNLG